MSELIKIDTERKLYVLSDGKYTSCLGFDYAYRRAYGVWGWMGLAETEKPSQKLAGSDEGYAQYAHMMEMGREYARTAQRQCSVELKTRDHNTELDQVLARLNSTRQRVRLFLGDATTGKAWAEEYGVIGEIGKSTGWMPCYILVNNARSHGGGEILINSIVRIVDTQTKRVLYTHPSFDVGEYVTREIGADEMCGKVNLRAEGYTHAVDHNGDNVANFKSQTRAANYIAFMRGKRMSK